MRERREHVNRKKWLILMECIFSILLLVIPVIVTIYAVFRVNQNTNFDIESLRWSIIGAIGGWMGSIFGAIALVVSLLAFWLPQRVKIEVEMSTGLMLGQISGMDRIDAYIITVKNTGMKAITINNIYLHFGDRKQSDIFVGMLNQGSILQSFTPQFPRRLDQGESFQYYLLRDKLNTALAHSEKKRPVDSPLSIRVDEVTKGTQYYKTKWTLENFIKKDKSKEEL